MRKSIYISILALAFFTFDQAKLSDAANFCNGKSNGNYVDPERCNGYIACSNGIAYKMPCPANLHYNSKGDYCDYPYNLNPKCKAGKPVNPCKVENGGCDQKCSSTGKTVTCSCNNGFIIDDDKKTCIKAPINGNWGAWEDYEKCDAKCGNGKQLRTRVCDKPKPENGGSPCVTTAGRQDFTDVQSKSCNIITCPLTPPLPTSPTSCGKDKQSALGEIVGGTEARRNRWIWQGGIYYNNNFLCGGSLVYPNVFVTAAHCMTGRSKDVMIIRMGDHERNKVEGPEQERQVDEIIVHEGWSYGTISNDIAIIKLKKDFKLNENVGTVCLPVEENGPAPNTVTCYITGWGITGKDDNGANVLQEAEMPIVPNNKCSRRNKNKQGNSLITETMLCGGYQGPDSKVSGCKGDSGGPYVCKLKNGNSWVLQGVVSWGSSRCNATHKYTVFTRVSKYVNWIDENAFPEP